MSVPSLVFVWLDKRSGHLPGGNEKLKEKFRKVLSPIRQFDKPSACLDSIKLALKDKCVFFLTSNSFADGELLKRVAFLPNVHRMYIYDQGDNDYRLDDPNLARKLGPERIIRFDEQLYRQVVSDLVKVYSKESEQSGQVKQAKDLLELAVSLINTVEDRDEELQSMEQQLAARINHLT